MNIGNIVVANEQPFAKVFQDGIQSVEMQKKKILEMYYDKYKIEKRYLWKKYLNSILEEKN